MSLYSKDYTCLCISDQLINTMIIINCPKPQGLNVFPEPDRRINVDYLSSQIIFCSTILRGYTTYMTNTFVAASKIKKKQFG